MKAILPVAGRGTRLRPHTHHTPKPLFRVAGKPVLEYILDDLLELGVEEAVFITGYMGHALEEWVRAEYPDLEAHFVEQEVQDGTAGAVKLAEPWADSELLIVFTDTLFDADMSVVKSLPDEWAGVIWAKEVEDYQRFGVILTDDDGAMERIIEKPSEPISRLANIGLYYIRDHPLLFEGIDHALETDPGPGGEYFLTDAFQYMIDQGARIRTDPVEGWYDCGKPETVLATNRHLLEAGRGTVDETAVVEDSSLEEPVRIEVGAEVRGTTLGPGVTVERGARIVDSMVRSSIIGAGAIVEGCNLHDSVVGEGAELRGFRGTLSVAADSAVEGA